MKSTPITDHEVEALIAGVPAGRRELDELAGVLAGLRRTTLPPPTPSSKLAAWMRVHRPSSTTPSTPRPARRRLAAWIAGLSIGAQVALGTTVAAAALTGAGFADVLPEVMQRPFDDVRDRLGPIDQSGPPPSPAPSEDLPPAQDTADAEPDDEIQEPVRPVPASTTRPDPGPGPQHDDSDKPDLETGTAPGSDETSDAEAPEPDASDEPGETDREEEQTPQAPDAADATHDTDTDTDTDDLTTSGAPHGNDDTTTSPDTDSPVEDDHDAVGDDTATGAPASNASTMDGIDKATAVDPTPDPDERSDVTQDE